MGVIAVLASVIPLDNAFFALQDLRNPGMPFRFAVQELVMCAMAFVLLGIGIRFLRFAWSGRNDPSNSWFRPVLLGIGSFFPGFIVSLPLAMLWADHTWPGDRQSYLAAIDASFCVGVAAAIICFVVLLKKRNVRHI